MAYKKVCLNCRVAFSLSQVTNSVITLCPNCGVQFKMYNHKFRPPKRTDIKRWKVIQYLYSQGFIYQHVYKNLSLRKWYAPDNCAEYPTNMRDAVEFVELYKRQSIKQIS